MKVTNKIAKSCVYGIADWHYAKPSREYQQHTHTNVRRTAFAHTHTHTIASRSLSFLLGISVLRLSDCVAAQCSLCCCLFMITKRSHSQCVYYSRWYSASVTRSIVICLTRVYRIVVVNKWINECEMNEEKKNTWHHHIVNVYTHISFVECS